jgi:3-deoxy-D-manno-octulosonic-acid transferase
MWKLIYNIGAYCAFPFFALFALTKKKIRKTFLQRLYIYEAPEMQGVLWIHAASVGEAVIAENLVNYMSGRTGFSRFVITTNTDYTHDLLTRRLGGRAGVFYLPFDLTCAIQRFMTRSTFEALILVETEIWPNLVWAAHARGIPVIIMNGRISDRTVKSYQTLSFFLKHVLSSIDLVLAQSQEQAERFISIGMSPSRVVDVGNLKYYRFSDHTPDTAARDKIITFGSIKEKELPIILPLIEPLKKSFPDHVIYLVPRDLSLVNTMQEKLSGTLRISRFSALKGGSPEATDVVIVDTMGDLMTIYSRSLLAFVGGSLAPYGGQNMLEPLFFATPVLFGPHVENFRQIADSILAAGAGMQVNDGRALLEAIRALIATPDLRRSMGNAGLEVIREQEAVMTRTVTLITEALWRNSPGSRS